MQLRPKGRRENSKLSVSFGVLSCFADNAIHGFRRLRSIAEPFVHFFEVNGVVDSFFHGVIGANLFDWASVTAVTAVDGYDFVIRTVFRAFSGQSECYHINS